MKKLNINLLDVLCAVLFIIVMLLAILFTTNKLMKPVQMHESCDVYSNYPLGYIPSRCIKQYLPEVQVEVVAPEKSEL